MILAVAIGKHLADHDPQSDLQWLEFHRALTVGSDA
jgi:hypothetical protein